MVEIRLYGRLRAHAPDPRPDGESLLQAQPRPGERLGELLERLGIPKDEVYHVFLNGTLAHTHNSMALGLGYLRAERQPAGGGSALDLPLRPGDRLGLFAADMALLVV